MCYQLNNTIFLADRHCKNKLLDVVDHKVWLEISIRLFLVYLALLLPRLKRTVANVINFTNM